MSAVSGAGVEETADSALSLMLQLYRRTHWLASHLMRDARRSLTPEQLRDLPAAASITTIRGEQLGLVGLGILMCCISIVFCFSRRRLSITPL